MKIELSTKGEFVLILVIAAIVGALWGGLFPSSQGYSTELSVSRENFMIAEGLSVSAQSLKEGTSTSYGFPPPEFVFERIEFEVSIINASGGMLEVNFTRDGQVLRTEYIHGSEKIILSSHGEYRLEHSTFDVTMRAINGEVNIRHLLINVSRGTKEYHPAFSAVSFSIFVGLSIVLPLYLKRLKHH